MKKSYSNLFNQPTMDNSTKTQCHDVRATKNKDAKKYAFSCVNWNINYQLFLKTYFMLQIHYR